MGTRGNPWGHGGDEERRKATSTPPSEARGGEERVYPNLCDDESGTNAVKGASERSVTDAHVSRMRPNRHVMGVVGNTRKLDTFDGEK